MAVSGFRVHSLGFRLRTKGIGFRVSGEVDALPSEGQRETL